MGRQGIFRMAAWLCAAGLASWLAVACQKVELPSEEKEEKEQAEPGKEEDEGRPDGGDETDGGGEDGDSENVGYPDFPDVPYAPGTTQELNVEAFLAIYTRVNIDTTGYEARVSGYIVGACSRSVGKSYFSAEKIGEENLSSNILVADSKDVTDVTRCIPLELTDDGGMREAVNLVDHPENLGRRIGVFGLVQRYCNAVGLKDITFYQWLPDVPDEPDEEPDTPDDHPDEPDVPDENPDEEQPDEEPDVPDVPDTPDDEPEEGPDEEQPEEAKDTLAIDPKPEIVPGGRSV